MSEKKEVTKVEETRPDKMSSLPSAVPLVDIFENDTEILLHADMPGLKKDDISINIDNGKLTICGSRRVDKSGAATWEEFGDVEYRRVFSVPQTIDVGQVNAELKEGVLRLHLPKSERAKPRQIEISAG